MFLVSLHHFIRSFSSTYPGRGGISLRGEAQTLIIHFKNAKTLIPLPTFDISNLFWSDWLLYYIHFLCLRSSLKPPLISVRFIYFYSICWGSNLIALRKVFVMCSCLKTWENLKIVSILWLLRRDFMNKNDTFFFPTWV